MGAMAWTLSQVHMLKPYSPVWRYWNRVYKEVINVQWYQKGGALINKIQFSRSVISNSLQPHGLQHTTLPCPSPSPRVYSNSCPSSQWCHPTISSSVAPFSSCLQSFPASGSFPMSQFFTSGGQSIGASDQSFQWIFRTDFLKNWLVLTGRNASSSCSFPLSHLPCEDIVRRSLKCKVLVSQLCVLCNPMDCSPPGSPVYGIF